MKYTWEYGEILRAFHNNILSQTKRIMGNIGNRENAILQTVVCSVTWPVNASEAGGDLALIQASVFSNVNAN